MRIAMLIPDNRDEFRRYLDPEPYFGPAPMALLEGLANFPDCEIHVISCVQKPLASPSNIAKNIHYHSIQVGKWGWMRGAYLGCISAVRRKLKEIQPQIVHGQGTERFCALAAAYSGYPNVVTIHGNMRTVAKALKSGVGSYYWLAAKFETLALAGTTGVFCNSSYTQSLVDPKRHKTWLVPNALQSLFFEPLPERHLSACPKLLNVGHIASYKRQVELLRMAERLHQNGCEFEIQFVGLCNRDTAYGREFMALLSKAQEMGYARYLGVKSTKEVIAALDSADGMIHCPSEEAFGLSAAEGLSRNLKFFGTRTGGVLDIAAGVEGAELVPMDDWDALQEVIEKWLKSGAPRVALAAAEMRSRYHPSRIAGRHLEIYREVVSGLH